jgi:hypothetical protein
MVVSSPFRFNATLNGTGNFVVASALPGCMTPEQANATDGKVYKYYAQSADGTQWEAGSGVYTISTHTLARTAIVATSNDGIDLVNFATPPIVDVFESPPSSLEPDFPSGTLMLFQQSTAPPGWTKQTTHNDKALRVVSGAASSGGTNSFSSMFASRTSDAHTLTIAEIPSHAHGEPYPSSPLGGTTTHATYNYLRDIVWDTQAIDSTSSVGGDGPHSHAYDMRVQYVDLIIAQKN